MIGIQQCFICEEPVNPNTVYKRFGHKFCSEDCLEVFDARNDYAHEKEYQREYQKEGAGDE